MMLDEMIDTQIDQINALDLPEEEKQKFEETMRQLFNGAEMLASYKENLRKSLTTEELKRLNEIQQHPLSQKLRDTQAHFQTPEGQQELMKSLLDSKKSPFRSRKRLR